jgi:hypothetical protein
MVRLTAYASSAVVYLALALLIPVVNGHAMPSSSSMSTATATVALSRRGFGLILGRASAAAALGSVAYCDQALAKGGNDLADDKAKLVKGLERLNYLLSNWEAETTVCGMNDNPYTGTKGCERTPLKVMDYMGYKSMDDPLFKADKTMRRLEVLVPSDKESDYLEAIEKWAWRMFQVGARPTPGEVRIEWSTSSRDQRRT